MHHCDERLPTSELKSLFPAFKWPDTMPDKDTVWHPTGRETEDEMVARAAKGLAIIMDHARDDVCECSPLLWPRGMGLGAGGSEMSRYTQRKGQPDQAQIRTIVGAART